MEKDGQAKDNAKSPDDGKRVLEPLARSIGDHCRCKETAIMKPRQLVQLMIDDLSFWKKSKKK